MLEEEKNQITNLIIFIDRAGEVPVYLRFQVTRTTVLDVFVKLLKKMAAAVYF